MPTRKPTPAMPVHDRTEADKQRIYERRAARRSRRVWGRRFLNVFLVFHIFVIGVWLAPSNLALSQKLVPNDGGGWVRAYLIASGFEQAWQMFSPNPDTRDLDIVAHVTLRDGQTRDWRFPQMRRMGYAEKYEKERMRKFLEIANYRETLWPGMAAYAARQCDTVPGSPPTLVTLTRYTRDIPPPGQPMPPYTVQEFFRMAVGAQRTP